MTDLTLSRRILLSSAAATPGLAATDRTAEFMLPPDRVGILTAVAQSVVPAPEYNGEEVKEITSELRIPAMSIGVRTGCQ